MQCDQLFLKAIALFQNGMYFTQYGPCNMQTLIEMNLSVSFERLASSHGSFPPDQDNGLA